MAKDPIDSANEKKQTVNDVNESLKESIITHLTSSLANDFDFLDRVNRLTFGLINGKSQIRKRGE